MPRTLPARLYAVKRKRVLTPFLLLYLQNDPRTALTTLAEYYLLADPATTFFEFNNTNETTTSWTRRFVAAAAYDVGQPTGPWSLAASGDDPLDSGVPDPTQ